ncbi:MAG TPA: NADP-dependent oxidoreductase [Paracoccaceae bacterium]|nr:NADP-dependent oxidoreductase [Paracoccaceae bacterium]
MVKGERVVFVAHPEGVPDERHLRLEPVEVPEPGPGEVLLRTIWLSLDPYMRGRMNPGRSYAAGVEPGDTMVGETVSEVMASRHASFAQGDVVLAQSGWCSHALMPGEGLRRAETHGMSLSTALGVLGMPGLTAYAGLKLHGRPQPGETLVVSAASGAVGQVVGQVARILGARAVGIAGGEEKCRLLIEAFGFDAAVDHRAGDFAQRLAASCPKGIDVYFDNVGGKVLETVLPLMNDFGRIPICGRIAVANWVPEVSGPDPLVRAMALVLWRRLTIRGFLVFDHADLAPAFRGEMAGWLREGRVRYREDVVEGLGNALAAFRGLFEGRNRGKLVVRIGPDPAGRGRTNSRSRAGEADVT